MAAEILLLVFLLVLAMGLGIILYVSKNRTHFNQMSGWALFAYLFFAFITLLTIVDNTPVGG